ncbi:MAG: zinc ABC transporter substrate-binding protein, partial [Pseudomonadota bacterium]|nr:zinc ABC transporter substrate-binding protein [Pseudomonadota bacterium]
MSRIGGNHISSITLVGRDGDTHVYRPTPADARAVKEASILFVNGLEFEGWMERLVDASGFDGLRVVATEGIEPIPFKDEHDDHKDGHDK